MNMSLSRTENRRRSHAIPPWRWALLIIGFLVFLCVAFFVYVRSADSDYTAEERQAIRIAKTEAGLKEIDGTYKHVWEETVWVVAGTDEQGEKWMVWERANEVVKEKLSGGYNENQIVSQFRLQHPGTNIVRILPGWFQNQPAWEIRYVSDPETKRQAIDFYQFQSGKHLKTYDLPGK
ncbi:DUF5590 domain-containing protein [Cohnella thailandensis]|uniref:DUF5590 domain-containing protein n=1 Tax=Cohnella thailandensis TaxID=557557 RepID=A0A841STT3_9BACL|nr:DUF5590 domain-containing protein [Cohnella thailandensis]MBB6635344.1 DUF5590 domain-containing protein [Cohnella thailandensis]MBP1974723.1 uncharacterized protein YpmB [Cohnella thailandensis]